MNLFCAGENFFAGILQRNAARVEATRNRVAVRFKVQALANSGKFRVQALARSFAHGGLKAEL
jgi:hypothetical protein